MKKKLEAELISIAHRILKLKSKSDVIQLHQETQKLYEKLSVLRFVEENLSDIKPTIGKEQAVELIEEAFGREPEVAEPNSEKEESAPEVAATEFEGIPQPPEVINELADEKEPEEIIAEAESDIENDAREEDQPEEQDVMTAQAEEAEEEPVREQMQEPVAEEETASEPETAAETQSAPEVKHDPADIFSPSFEWAFDRKEEPKVESKEEPAAEMIQGEKPSEPVQQSAEVKEALAQAEIAFEDLLGPGYVDPVFVKSEDLYKEMNAGADKTKEDVIPISRAGDKIQVIKMNNSEIADRTVSLNDRLSKGITVGLNDRIAFVKHLFNNSNEDYNRVLSQLITFATFEEAKEFIDNMVKPDYNNWEGRDEYAQRFMDIIEKKFS